MKTGAGDLDPREKKEGGLQPAGRRALARRRGAPSGPGLPKNRLARSRVALFLAPMGAGLPPAVLVLK
jgi:hypothetical protein